MRVARHPLPEELVGMPLEDIMKRAMPLEGGLKARLGS
jgi:hypothetical protein